jgi:hypothetical protein
MMFYVKSAAVVVALVFVLAGGAAVAQMPPGHPDMMAPPPGGPLHGMIPFKHVEGVLAFLRAELKITDGQAAQWDALAEVVRTEAKALEADHQAHEAVEHAGTPPTPPEAIQDHIKMVTSHLEALKKVQAVLTPLYAGLSDEQKKAADDLLHDLMCEGPR